MTRSNTSNRSTGIVPIMSQDGFIAASRGVQVENIEVLAEAVAEATTNNSRDERLSSIHNFNVMKTTDRN